MFNNQTTGNLTNLAKLVSTFASPVTNVPWKPLKFGKNLEVIYNEVKFGTKIMSKFHVFFSIYYFLFLLEVLIFVWGKRHKYHEFLIAHLKSTQQR